MLSPNAVAFCGMVRTLTYELGEGGMRIASNTIQLVTPFVQTQKLQGTETSYSRENNLV